MCAPETELALKPARASFAQAAALPQAAVLALQGIRDYGRVQPGQRVLVNGAGGGVGTFAIQLAKAAGAEVTGVDSAMKPMVRGRRVTREYAGRPCRSCSPRATSSKTTSCAPSRTG